MSTVEITAEDLLVRVAARDQDALRQLYDQYAPRMLAAARRILGENQLAEDAVQEAFLRIWRSAGRYDPARGAAGAWLGRILRNAALDRLPRSAERSMERIEDVEPIVLQPEPLDARVGQCLKKLTPSQAEAVILQYVHGLTHSELAVRLDVPLGTAKSWSTRGLAALRQCMDNGL